MVTRWRIGAAQPKLERPTAHEIYEQVSRNARHELERSMIALRPEFVGAMTELARQAISIPCGHVCWSAVIGGIVALVAWLASGSHSITGSVMLVWMLTFLVGIEHFAHCTASSGEILVAVLECQVTAAEYFRWLLAAVPGNITNEVLIVTLLQRSQVKGGEPENHPSSSH